MSLGVILLGACGGDEEEEARPTSSAEVLEVQSLIRSSELVTAKVTYDAGRELDGDELVGTLVLYQRPPDLRIDYEGTSDGDELKMTLIETSSTSFICGQAPAEDTCTEVSAEEVEQQRQLFDGFFEPLQIVLDEGGLLQFVERLERPIAGVDAECFVLEEGAEGSTFMDGEVCFSPDGAFLAMDVALSTGFVSIEGLDFSTALTDEDFAPPFAVAE